MIFNTNINIYIYICNVVYIEYGASDLCQSVSNVHITVMIVHTSRVYHGNYIISLSRISRSSPFHHDDGRASIRLASGTLPTRHRIIIINCLARPLTYCGRE